MAIVSTISPTHAAKTKPMHNSWWRPGGDRLSETGECLSSRNPVQEVLQCRNTIAVTIENMLILGKTPTECRPFTGTVCQLYCDGDVIFDCRGYRVNDAHHS